MFFIFLSLINSLHGCQEMVETKNTCCLVTKWDRRRIKISQIQEKLGSLVPLRCGVILKTLFN